jgi:hypothetical protein
MVHGVIGFEPLLHLEDGALDLHSHEAIIDFDIFNPHDLAHGNRGFICSIIGVFINLIIKIVN